MFIQFTAVQDAMKLYVDQLSANVCLHNPVNVMLKTSLAVKTVFIVWTNYIPNAAPVWKCVPKQMKQKVI